MIPIQTIITAIISSGLVGAILTKVVTYYIESALKKKSETDNERQRENIELQLLISDRERAEGRLLFWLSEAAQGRNNEQQIGKAYGEFAEAEEAKKKMISQMALKYKIGEGGFK